MNDRKLDLHRLTLTLGVALLGALWGAANAAAQPISLPRIDFNFSNPGARSLGFGGAFAALADDATAAYANPAGLTQITQAEVSVEGRFWSRSTRFIAGGRIEGTPTGRGIDTVDGLLFGSAPSETTGLSFASVVIPKGRFSFALYGHQLALVELEAESQGFFFDFEPGVFPPGRFPASRERASADIVTAGAAAAVRVNDRLNLGLGVVRTAASLTTRTETYFPSFDSLDNFVEPIPLTPDRLFSTVEIDVDATDWTFNGGLLWSPKPNLTSALFYRQGASMDGVVRTAVPDREFPDTASTFNVPDVWGAGLAHRSRGGRFTAAMEVDRVEYYGLIETFDSEGEPNDGRAYPNAWEYHLGAEYALLQATPIVALRLGVWHEALDQRDLTSDDTTHFAVGLGIAAKSFQIDFAGDFSSEIDTLSLSFIYRL